MGRWHSLQLGTWVRARDSAAVPHTALRETTSLDKWHGRGSFQKCRALSAFTFAGLPGPPLLGRADSMELCNSPLSHTSPSTASASCLPVKLPQDSQTGHHCSTVWAGRWAPLSSIHQLRSHFSFQWWGKGFVCGGHMYWGFMGHAMCIDVFTSWHTCILSAGSYAG